ncbi:hypothetical protein G5B40_19285 [Pikeienuella piscinae]|uniref:Uncharacterized protein n=1 Tax=Pikeienuella piscinae TaxID=2748098 RepID=A0A7M3T5W8_9RHOB|nr:hypothetical protein [Pikeienuella piscinae]QIE57399.1 hypothetical protein G5B40_19285 [Pikeienuella piscinae]
MTSYTPRRASPPQLLIEWRRIDVHMAVNANAAGSPASADVLGEAFNASVRGPVSAAWAMPLESFVACGGPRLRVVVSSGASWLLMRLLALGWRVMKPRLRCGDAVTTP